MSTKLNQVRDRVRRAVTGQAPEAPEADEEVEEGAPPEEPAARESLLRALERGRALDHALISRAAGRRRARQRPRHRLGLREHPETETLGRLAGGIVAHREGYAELAWDLLRPVPREAWTRFAVSEYVRSGLSVAPEEVLAELRWWPTTRPRCGRSSGTTCSRRSSATARASSRGRSTSASTAAREDENPWDEAERRRAWMRPWIAADPGSPTAPATGRRTFAVIDYGHPGADRASAASHRLRMRSARVCPMASALTPNAHDR